VQELPGPRLAPGEIAARLRQIMQEQGIMDVQHYKLPLVEQRLASLPEAAVDKASVSPVPIMIHRLVSVMPEPARQLHN
jgi:hypothetical protein